MSQRRKNNMSMAIKYGMMKHAKKMARGGMMEDERPCVEHGTHMCKMCHGGKMMAEGGVIEEDDRMLNQHGMDEVGAMDMEEDNEPQHERMVSHPVENQDDHEDMVGRIMRQRSKHYS